MRRSLIVLGFLLPGVSALAATSDRFAACAGIADDGERLACYDRAAGREAPPPTASLDTALPVEAETPGPVETATAPSAEVAPPPSPFSTAVRPPGVMLTDWL